MRKGDDFGYNGTGYVSGYRAGTFLFALKQASPDPDQPYLEYSLSRITAGGIPIVEGGPHSPQSQEREVTFDRKNATEIYRPGPDAVEQLFVVRELPEARGELMVEGSLRTNLALPPTTATSVTLGRDGRELIRISKAVAIDSEGRRLPLDIEVQDAKLILRVPAEWVAKATLPITIDPLIGPVASLSRNATNSSSRPVDIAYGTGCDRFLVVWNDQFGATLTDWDVWGQWLDGSTGLPVGVPFAIDASPQGSFEAAVAYSPVTDRFAVVYRNDPVPDGSTADNDILVRVLSGDGTFVTPIPVNIDPRPGADERPDVVHTGTHFWLVRQNAFTPADHDILGALFDDSGVFVAAADPETGPNDDLTPAGAWLSDGLCVWTQRQGGTSQIVGRTMTGAGVFGTLTTYTAGGLNKLNPDAAANSASSRFLVAWEVDESATDHDIQVQVTDGAGTAVGAPIVVEADGVLQRFPRLLGVPENNEWFVVWDDVASGTRDIYGQRISGAGTLVGAQLLVGWGIQDQQEPAVGFRPSTRKAMVGWRTSSGATEVQAVSLDGRSPLPMSPTGPICTTTPTLSWSASSFPGATYQWQVAADSEFTTLTSSGTTTSTSATVGPLARAIHFWRIRATSLTLETSAWSGVLSFTIDSTPPPTPTLSSPADGSTTSDTTPLFGWPNLIDSCTVTYQIQVDNSGSAFPSPEIDVSNLSGSNYNTPAPLSEGLYWWRVRATDGSGNVGSWSAVWTVTINVPPPAPSLLSPANGACLGISPSFDWADVADPSGVTYEIQADNSGSGFPSPEINLTGLASSSYVPPGALADGTYSWRVRAIDGLGGTSAWTVRSFTLDTTPPIAPTLTAPANGSMATSGAPTFDWNDVAEPCAGTYQIQIDDSGPGFPSPEVDASGIPVSSYNSITLAEGTHSWRVRATDGAGNVGPWSAIWTVTINYPPGTPNLLAPPNNTCVITPNLDWSDVSDPQGITYDLQADSTGPGFGAPTLNLTGLVGSAYTPGAALAPGTYWWRVRAVDGAGVAGAWTFPARTFKVDTTAPAAPVLFSPADGGFTNDSTPLLDWVSVADTCSVTYQLQVDNTDNTFSSPEIDVSSLGSSDYIVTPSLPEGLYYWRVRATDGAGNVGPWSAPWSFTIDQTPPPAPTLLSPPDATMTTDTTPDFDWTDVNDPSGITYQIQADDSGPTFLTPEVNQSNLIPSAHTPSPLATGVYSWRVRAKDGAGNFSPWSSVWTITIDGPPAAPTLVSPANLACANTTPVFDWSDVTDPTGVTYDIQVDNSGSAFPSPELNVTGIVASTYTPIAPLAGGTYWWRVRAVDGTATAGPWSGFRRVVVDATPPSGPILQIPANGACTSDTTPGFDWSDAVDSCTVTYQIQVDDSGGAFSSPEIDVSGFAGSNYTAVPPLAEGTYSWHVRATDGQGNVGPWSATFTFTIDLTPPGTPVHQSPADGSCTKQTMPVLDWSDVADGCGSVTYDVQVDNSGAAFPSPEMNTNVLASTTAVTPPLTPGTWWWRVRARDAAGNVGPWTAAWTIEVDTTPPATPTLLAPPDGSMQGPTPTFDWSDVSDPCGITYELQADNSGPTFLSPEIDLLLSASTHTPGSPLAQGTYWWRVRAIDGGGNLGPWSTAWSFTYDSTPPSVPSGLQQYRSDGTTVIPWGGASDEPKIALAALVTDGQSTVRLHVEVVDLSASFSGTPSASSPLVPSGTTVQVSVGGLPGGPFKWQAWSEDSTGTASGKVEFTGPAGTDFQIDLNRPPATPTTLLQMTLGGRSTILVGGSTQETAVLLRAAVADPDGNAVRAQFQLVPTGSVFGPAGWVMGSWAVSGGISEAVLPLGLGSYHWQVRAEDRQGLTSAWVSFGGNADPGGVDVQRVADVGNAPPGPPSALGQFHPNGVTAVALGAVANDAIYCQATVIDGDGDACALEIEVKPVGTRFDGTDTWSGPYVRSGSVARVLVRMPPASYHWRARAADARGGTSGWTAFDANVDEPLPAGADFQIQSVANSAPTLSSLQQMLFDGATPIATGGSTSQGGFVVQATTADPNLNDGVCVEIEVKPVGDRFTNVPSVIGDFGAAGPVSAKIRGLAAGGSYHWQARVVDWQGAKSTWVPFGANADLPSPAQADVAVVASAPPVASGGGQFRSDAISAIAAGGATNETAVVFQAAASDGDSPTVRLELEVVPNGSPFTGLPNLIGDDQAPGTARVTAAGLGSGSAYKWRYRVSDSSGGSSPWIDFGASDPDFSTVMDFAPDAPSTLSQRKRDGTTMVSLGGQTSQNAFQMWATVTDLDASDQVRLQAEVKPSALPFDGTNLISSALVPAGGTVFVEAPLPALGFYHWRVRGVDQNDVAGPWVDFDGSTTSQIERVTGAPPTMTGLDQYLLDGVTVLALGGRTEESQFLIQALVNDPDGGDVSLDVEIRLAGTPFTNVATQTGIAVANGTTASVLVPIAVGGSYHWQVRAVDEAGDLGAWIPFGGNADPSGVDLRGPSPPSPPTVGGGGGGGGGCGATGAEAFLIAGLFAAFRRRRPSC